MARRFRLAVLGGSFDRLHVGHRALLDGSLRLADRIAVGITTDRFLAAHPKPSADRIEPFRERWRAVERYLATRAPRRRWRLAALDDIWGGSVRAGPDVLVATPDTRAGARSVNAERRRRGLGSLAVRLVPLVLAEDLRPVSSRRIRAGEIDAAGRRRPPVRVALVGGRATDGAIVGRTLRRELPAGRLLVRRLPARARRPGRRAGDPARGRDLTVILTDLPRGRARRVAVLAPEGPLGSPVRFPTRAAPDLPSALGQALGPALRRYAARARRRGGVRRPRRRAAQRLSRASPVAG